MTTTTPHQPTTTGLTVLLDAARFMQWLREYAPEVSEDARLLDVRFYPHEGEITVRVQTDRTVAARVLGGGRAEVELN